MTKKKRIEELEKKVSSLTLEMRELKEQLINIFGFSGYVDGFISEDDKAPFLVVDGYHFLKEDKLPVHNNQFRALLDFLDLEISPKHEVPMKIVKRKYLTGKNIKL